MKTINGIIAIGLTAFLVSCGSTQDSVSSTAESNRGRNTVETSENTNSRMARNSNAARTEENARRLAETEERLELNRMYSDLNMDQSQIDNFERQWSEAKNSWRRENRNQTMNSYERIEHQDRILNGILDDDQFSSYQQWVRDNASED